MKQIVLVILLILLGSFVEAQNLEATRQDSLDKRPCLTVNGKLVDPLSFFTINKYDIIDIKLLQPEKAIIKYGAENGKYGGIEISLNKDAEIITWPQILKKFYLKKDVELMKVRLSGIAYYNNFKMMVASPSRIHKMRVIVDRNLKTKIVEVDRPWTNAYDAPYLKKPTKFEKELDYVTKIFFEESNRRFRLSGEDTIKVYL